MKIDLGEGDPVWTVWTWKQDSLTLGRVRPLLEELSEWSRVPCERYTGGDTCLERRVGPLPRVPCWPCRLRDAFARLTVAAMGDERVE